MKIFAHKLRQNLAIIFAAAVCALVIFFIVKNPDFFQASILSLEEKAFMNEKRRDVAYKTKNNHFEIFVAEKHSTSMEGFKGTIYINPDTVEILTGGLTGQGAFKVTITSKDSRIVTIKDLENIDANEEIISIPFSGEKKDIVLGESKQQSKKGRTSLAVGNLNEFLTHSK